MSSRSRAVIDLPSDDRIRRILIIKWSAMGDVVMASAAFDDVVRAFPGRAIDLNVLPPWHRLFEGDPRFRRVLAHDLRGRQRGVRGLLSWVREVRAARYDLVVDLQSSDHTRVLLALLVLSGGAPRHRIGTHRRFPWNLYPGVVSEPANTAEYARAALAAGGIPSLAGRPMLHVSEEVREEVRSLLGHHELLDTPFAVLLPGSQAAGFLKRWGARNYAALARRLAERGIARVVIVGGPDERDECAAIAEQAGDIALDLCGQTGIGHIVPLCEAATLIVANDTGTAHVAAAAGKPLLVICGPTDPRRVRPLGDTVHTLQADLACINCYRKTCPHHACMRLIRPERVLVELEDWLPGPPRRV